MLVHCLWNKPTREHSQTLDLRYLSKHAWLEKKKKNMTGPPEQKTHIEKTVLLMRPLLAVHFLCVVATDKQKAQPAHINKHGH